MVVLASMRRARGSGRVDDRSGLEHLRRQACRSPQRVAPRERCEDRCRECYPGRPTVTMRALVRLTSRAVGITNLVCRAGHVAHAEAQLVTGLGPCCLGIDSQSCMMGDPMPM